MTKRINMNVGAAVGGGVGVGTMTSAGNPWTVADGLAYEVVNRGLAVLVDAEPGNPQPLLATPAQAAAFPGLVSGAGNTVAVVGDSIMKVGISDIGFTVGTVIPGINLAGGDCSLDCSVATTGLFEYRAADRMVRFTAPGDTAGPWTPITKAKNYTIASGTPTMTINVAMFPLRLAGADASSVLTFINTPQFTRTEYKNVPSWLECWSGQRVSILNACAPGALIDDLSDLLDDLRARESAAGVKLVKVIIQIGTNHFGAGGGSNNAALFATYAANIAKAKAFGWSVLVCSLPMRDLVASSVEQAAFRDFCKALPSFCLANGADYKAIWDHTHDPASAVLPLTGMTTDNKHPSGPSGFMAALRLWDALGALLMSIGQSPMFISAVDAYNSSTNPSGNLMPGTPAGSAGTAGAGGTATDVATSWLVQRDAGAITIVGDKVNLGDGGPSWQRLTYGAAGAITDVARYEYVSGTGVTTVSPGDTVEVFVELNVPANAGLRRLAVYAQLVGPARADCAIFENFDLTATYPDLPAIAWPGTPVVRLRKLKIPAGTTSLRHKVLVQTAVAATPVVNVRKVLTRKV